MPEHILVEFEYRILMMSAVLTALGDAIRIAKRRTDRCRWIFNLNKSGNLLLLNVCMYLRMAEEVYDAERFKI